MKKMFLFLLLSAMFVPVSDSQTLIQQIENAYNTLDSVSYIEDIILSYRGDWVIRYKGYEERVDLLTALNYFDSIPRQKQIIDSLWENLTLRSKTTIEEQINEFSDIVRATTPVYILNLIPQDKQTLQVDTGKLPFNLFYLGKHSKNNFYVFVHNGEYAYGQDTYPTVSRPIGKNIRKVLRKIMRKQPKYLLFCPELEEMNTILYVLNDKIYVYRVAQMKEYELSDYFKHFPR
ncbi:hypothetical protein PGS_00017020 [Porphyromonas gingivalis A7A1-28]|uniref:hypothetical protein n=1 Tax=Porphyromonas gingivalis TaxID=837 RepID=UPI000717B6B3|nr:hypothetical protein [Porphyromonas gingivalis]ALO30373.1 hypothetical protein PGS_00017020 [Porphyromonas gingivalis A7A1-28]MCE8178872.1 hypothetical protein [Porphyromonas gingivalis]OWR82648.1 hypothetical protein SJDPG12_04750 [Porphyromonas gingivalis SJD12]